MIITKQFNQNAGPYFKQFSLFVGKVYQIQLYMVKPHTSIAKNIVSKILFSYCFAGMRKSQYVLEIKFKDNNEKEINDKCSKSLKKIDILKFTMDFLKI